MNNAPKKRKITVVEFPKGQKPVVHPSIPIDTPSAETRIGSASFSQSRRTRSSSKQSPADLAYLGHQLFQRGDLVRSKEIFEKLVNKGAQDAFPYTMLGTIYLALGDFEKSLGLFNSALLIDSQDYAALCYRGEIRLNQRRTRLALVDLKKAMVIAPKSDPFSERARRLLKVANKLLKAKEKA